MPPAAVVRGIAVSEPGPKAEQDTPTLKVVPDASPLASASRAPDEAGEEHGGDAPRLTAQPAGEAALQIAQQLQKRLHVEVAKAKDAAAHDALAPFPAPSGGAPSVRRESVAVMYASFP